MRMSDLLHLQPCLPPASFRDQRVVRVVGANGAQLVLLPRLNAADPSGYRRGSIPRTLGGDALALAIEGLSRAR